MNYSIVPSYRRRQRQETSVCVLRSDADAFNLQETPTHPQHRPTSQTKAARLGDPANAQSPPSQTAERYCRRHLEALPGINKHTRHQATYLQSTVHPSFTKTENRRYRPSPKYHLPSTHVTLHLQWKRHRRRRTSKHTARRILDILTTTWTNTRISTLTDIPTNTATPSTQ